ncbi:MAG: CehA/McbA family metallohydrolase [Chloroflexi bacterium]|nr:CehA/McbA family metallohydrolase [Chloroflexota bacterium]
MHCHTHHSDGDSDVMTVIRKAETIGLDFLAITDHNVLSQQVALASAETRLMLIPGMEVTTYKGHWNIWGAGPWIDFRVLSQDDMQTAVDAALAAGYLISCNHPRPFGPEWSYPEVTGFHCIEVWNGPWPPTEQGSRWRIGKPSSKLARDMSPSGAVTAISTTMSTTLSSPTRLSSSTVPAIRHRRRCWMR